MMNITEKHFKRILIITAFVVSMSFEYKLFLTISDNSLRKIFWEFLRILFDILIFCTFAFFNYSWKDKLLSHNLSKTSKVFLILIANILIYWMIALFMNALTEILYELYEWRLELNYFIQMFDIVWMALFLAYLLRIFRKIKTAEVENIRLKEEKAKAELASLKEQISPHFFFNTLSSLSAVVRNEKKEVGLEYIQEMSKTYRYTLSIREQDTVSLKEELDFVKSYLFVNKKRFGDGLLFNVDVSDRYFLSKILPMSLQSLVENAIQHNIFTKTSPLTIEIFIEKNMICVQNNLRKKERTDSLGLGLENLSQRYRLLAQKDVIIEQDKHYFRVRLPLL